MQNIYDADEDAYLNDEALEADFQAWMDTQMADYPEDEEEECEHNYVIGIEYNWWGSVNVGTCHDCGEDVSRPIYSEGPWQR